MLPEAAFINQIPVITADTGLELGRLLGVLDGTEDRLGKEVGHSLGLVDGALVGTAGTMVEGKLLGAELGASLGMEVDTLMGVRDGPLVVVFVGDAVGAIVTNGEG